MNYPNIKWKAFAVLFGLFSLNFFSYQNAVLADEVKADIKASEKVSPKKVSLDTNKDGQPDRSQYYDEKGQIIKVESDVNYDGKVDEWAAYENGKLVKVEKDADHDGKADQWIDY